MSCENCGRQCKGERAYPCTKYLPTGICRLASDKYLVIAPHDKGSPPSWVAPFKDMEVHWIDRKLFNQLRSRRFQKPCDICPDSIKSKCTIATEEDYNRIMRGFLFEEQYR